MSNPLRKAVQHMISDFLAGKLTDRALAAQITNLVARPPYPGPIVQNLSFAFAAGIEHLDTVEQRRLIDALALAEPRLGETVARIGAQFQSQ